VPRYKLTIAYDGTEFCGWQKQFPHADAVPPGVHAFKEGDPRGWEAEAGVIQLGSATSPEAEVPPEVNAARVVSASDFPHPTSHIDTRPRRELRTVQAVVERAVRMVVRERIILSGASRTDAGVHARGQVASFKCSPETGAPMIAAEVAASPAAAEGIVVPRAARGERGGGWPIERGTVPLMRAINARLPDDVLVRSIKVVPDAFNPIANCTSKGYSYTVWCSDHRPLRERKTALHLWQRMDVAAMRAAAAEIVGEHDFAGFAAAGHGRLTTVRTVFGCEVVEEEGTERRSDGATEGGQEEAVEWPQLDTGGEADGEVQKLVIRVWGNGFLWNMVRIIAGTLIEAGKGKCGPERVREALRTGNRRMAGSTLPAHGLCLEWIRYGHPTASGASGVVDEE